MADYKYTFDLEPIKKPSRFKGGLGVPDAPEEQDDDRSAVTRMYDILAGYFTDEDEAKKALAPIKPMPDEGYLDQMLKTLEGIKVPADQETPMLDELQGQDVDSTEDATQVQAKRIQDSAVTTFKAPESAGLMAKPSVADGVQPTDGKGFETRLEERLVELEGFEAEAYKPDDTEEYFTIGYGHYGSDVKKGTVLTEAEARELLRKDIKKRMPKIKKAIKNFDSLSDDLKVEIAQSWFRGGISGSPKTIKLINEGKFEEAATEFLDNEEYRTTKLGGVKTRMEALSNALKAEDES
jgi:GH24 family phage-related lysozyme (muramidase)